MKRTLPNRTKALLVLLVFVLVGSLQLRTAAQNAGTGNITPLQGLPSGIQKPFTQATILSGTTVGTVANTGSTNGTANTYIYVTEAQCINSSASTVSVGQLLSTNAASGQTTLAFLPCPAAGANAPMVPFNPPIKLAANTAMGASMTVSAATSYITVGGYYTNR